jgi:release factor glutamine methyltransferase
MKQKILSLIHQLAEQLNNYEHTSEREQIAWWLVELVTKKNRAALLAEEEIELTSDQEKNLQQMIQEHVEKNKPLQYIFGMVPFNDIELFVEPPVLIPRPETEEWVCSLIESLKKLTNKKIKILDIGAGSGAISCALAHAFPEAEVVAVDIAHEALALTQKNIGHNKITNLTILESDLFSNLPEGTKFDLIVSNPPYISSDEYKKLDDAVKDWEDKRALLAEHKGLAIIEKIIQHAPEYLQKNDDLFLHDIPQLSIEIGYKQGAKVKELMQNALYKKVKVIQDLEGKDRIIVGRIS